MHHTSVTVSHISLDVNQMICEERPEFIIIFILFSKRTHNSLNGSRNSCFLAVCRAENRQTKRPPVVYFCEKIRAETVAGLPPNA